MEGHRNYDRPMILAVDDCQSTLLVIEKILEDMDAQLVKAHSGREALSLVLRHSFALILLDIQMPEIDGFETATLMRSYLGSKDTPIIFVTAEMKSEAHIKRGYEVGGVDYLFKPLDVKILRSKVHVFLEMDAKAKKLKETMMSLHVAGQRNRMLLDCAGEGIIGYDLNGKIIFANPMAGSLLGCNHEQLSGRHLLEFLGPKYDGSRVGEWELTPIYAACFTGSSYKRESDTLYRSNGLGFPVAFTVNAATLEDMGYAGGVMVFRDITERKEVEARLLRLARYDQLTELANRTFFREFLEATIARAKRRAKLFALFFIDLDGFKEVNDQLGHQAGDQLLKEVAKRLKECIRIGDLAARLGGDEFCLVFDDLSKLDDCYQLSEKLWKALSQPYLIDGRETVISSSIGVATFPDMSTEAEELIQSADMAMYHAKKSGKNKIQFFEPRLHEQVMERNLLTLELRRASARLNEFQVYFQPKVDGNEFKIIGVEALVRWFHPELGMISPGKFVPIAESTGVITTIGDWVFEESCRITRNLQRQGLISEDWKLAVNVSLRQLKEGHFIRNLSRVLKETGFKPENLEIEITESMFMEDTKYAVHILQEIHNLGVTIAVDDFGTGYSSLNYLSRLPIDVLKIDRSFVMDIGKDSCEDTIVRAIISLAHSLDLKVVAEGVEKKEHIEFLKRNQCDAFQGYYFSKPLNLVDLTELLTLKYPFEKRGVPAL
ncbi:EAL domain-containing protein [Sulfidibacter corallicola]|uniref:EAL domain-containing protein n=1 Tax=Sulfidibacter corallicola TaxID=2818388 RepID=A0A8A4TSI8_SULCO|nr:EAL domain-containing protein [Sulfidibacter corallicola]QTD52473.1 EAL domain-containing protein [Sulfidibacter corallicola]